MNHSKTLDDVEIVRRLCDGAISRLLVNNLRQSGGASGSSHLQHPQGLQQLQVSNFKSSQQRFRQFNSRFGSSTVSSKQQQYNAAAAAAAVALNRLNSNNPLFSSFLAAFAAASAAGVRKVDRQTQTTNIKGKRC